MTANADIVRAYMTAYAAGDRDAVGVLLTDDVVWVVYGHAQFDGRKAFLDEMRRGEAAGLPTISVDRLVEDGDLVCATGHVRAPLTNGGELHLAFSDLFTFRDDRIARLEAYLVPLATPRG